MPSKRVNLAFRGFFFLCFLLGCTAKFLVLFFLVTRTSFQERQRKKERKNENLQTVKLIRAGMKRRHDKKKKPFALNKTWLKFKDTKAHEIRLFLLTFEWQKERRETQGHLKSHVVWHAWHSLTRSHRSKKSLSKSILPISSSLISMKSKDPINIVEIANERKEVPFLKNSVLAVRASANCWKWSKRYGL